MDEKGISSAVQMANACFTVDWLGRSFHGYLVVTNGPFCMRVSICIMNSKMIWMKQVLNDNKLLLPISSPNWIVDEDCQKRCQTPTACLRTPFRIGMKKTCYQFTLVIRVSCSTRLHFSSMHMLFYIQPLYLRVPSGWQPPEGDSANDVRVSGT